MAEFSDSAGRLFSDTLRTMLRTGLSPALPAIPAALLVAVPLLAGCGGGTATVEAAPQADDPQCAEVMLAMPESIDDFDQRETTSQGTTVWGDPSQVVARCGVEPPGPSPELCVNAEGVDWLALEESRADDVVLGEGISGQADEWRLVSYGREPAVEVLLDVSTVPSSTVMLAVAGAVENIEQTSECTETDQEIGDTSDGAGVDGESAVED